MAIDIGLDDPEALEALALALAIIDDVVGPLHDAAFSTEYAEDCEVHRLACALPAGPITLDRTLIAALDASRAALDQISYILRRNTPTTLVVLQSLLRTALVGAGRGAFALLPADPSERLRNARLLVSQETVSFIRALDRYAEFEQFSLLRPDEQYVRTAREQSAAVLGGTRPKGDGAVMDGAAGVIADALGSSSPDGGRSHQILREHITWLWNTYSGLAHTHAWPRLLPGYGQDRQAPGDFAGDLFMVASVAHLAMLAFRSRLQPGTAETTSPVVIT